jgi:hypothetical protein
MDFVCVFSILGIAQFSLLVVLSPTAKVEGLCMHEIRYQGVGVVQRPVFRSTLSYRKPCASGCSKEYSPDHHQTDFPT